MNRIVFALLTLSLFLGFVLLPAPADAQLATRKSADRGVTVAVTPGELSAGARIWVFKVVLDTHSQDLSDDLVANAVLAGGATPLKPLAWEGAGAGGHHRSGLLKFRAITPRPRVVELRISRPGEPQPRLFRWELE